MREKERKRERGRGRATEPQRERERDRERENFTERKRDSSPRTVCACVVLSRGNCVLYSDLDLLEKVHVCILSIEIQNHQD